MKTILLLLLAVSPLFAQGGGMAQLLDPAQHLAKAKSAFGAGQADEGTKHLQVALEASALGTDTWSQAYQLAMQRRSDLFAQALVGANFPVPLAVLPEDDILYAPDELFTIPPWGPLTGYLGRGELESFLFRVNHSQWQDAAHVLEEALDKSRNNIQALLLVANLYERHEQLALAQKRYDEIIEKAQLTDQNAFFTALFGVFRTQYRRQDFKAAELTLDRYLRAAQVHLSDAMDRWKTSARGKDELYSVVLEGRRHLVEGLNSKGIIKALRNANQEAAYLFEQAYLLAPGSIPLALNRNLLQQRARLLNQTRNGLATLATGLSGLEQALMAQLDRQIDSGSLDLGIPLTFRELLRNQVARIRVRQALFEMSEGEQRVGESLLVQAASLADTSAIAHYFLGRHLQKKDRLDEALVHYQRAMAVGSPVLKIRVEAKKRVDEIFELQGLRQASTKTRDDQLREHFESKLDPAQLQILRRDIADCVEWLQKREFEKARAHLIRLAEYHKDNLEIYRFLGYANQELSQFKEALIAYDQALAIDKSDPWSLSQKAICLYEFYNDLPNALEMAEKAVAIKNDDPMLLSNMGWLQVMANDVRQGSEAIKAAIEKAPKDPRHHMRLAMAYYNTSQWPFAESKLRDVLGLDPKHPKAAVFLGITLARMGRTSEAIDQLSSSVEIVKADAGLNELVVKNLALLKGGGAPVDAPGPKGKNDPQLPLTKGEIARATEANQRLQIARDLVLKGELAQAKVVLEAAHKDFPSVAEVAYCHAFLLLQSGTPEDLATAKTVVGGMLDLNTQDARAYHALASILFREGKTQEMADTLARISGLPEGLAFSEFLQAVGKRWAQVLDLDRSDQKAMSELGLVYLHQGKLAQAREVLTKATTPAGKLVFAEVLLRQFYRERRQLDFQEAQAAAQAAGYAFLPQLDVYWKAVTRPQISALEARVVKDMRQVPAKEEEGWWRMGDLVKESARSISNAVSQIDMNKTGIPQNRRWAQIDQSRRRRQEQLDAARTHEQEARDQDKRDRAQRAEEQRIRKNLASPGKRAAAPHAGGPEPLGGIAVGAADDEAPKNQLHVLSSRQLQSGLAQVKTGRLADAAREFQGAISMDPDNREAYLSLAMALVVGRDTARARPILRTVQQKFGPGVNDLAVAGHAAWLDGDVQGAARAWAAITPVRAREAAERESANPRRRAHAKPKTSQLPYLQVSRQAWASTLADAPGDADANLALAQLDLFSGDAAAAIKRLEPLTGTLEGASAYAEACLFAAATGGGEKLLTRAIHALAEIEGAESFALQKRLKSLLGPRGAVAPARVASSR